MIQITLNTKEKEKNTDKTNFRKYQTFHKLIGDNMRYKKEHRKKKINEKQYKMYLVQNLQTTQNTMITNKKQKKKMKNNESTKYRNYKFPLI